MRDADSALDLELVVRARAGDRDAYGELVRRHATVVRAMLSRSVRGVHEIEDLEQSVFLRAWSALDTLRDPSRFRAWLATIAANEGAAWGRSRARRGVPAREVGDLVDPGPGPSETLEAGEERAALVAAVRAAVSDLGDEARWLLQSRTADDLPFRAIAVKLGIAEDAARQRYARALECVRRRLMGGRPFA